MDMKHNIRNMSGIAHADHDCRSYVAAIFGATGLVGIELATKLVSTGNWKVYGVARKPRAEKMSHDFVKLESNANYHFVLCDLLNSMDTQAKLSQMKDLTHVFWVTWASHFPLDTKECYDQNKAMMLNALNAILPAAKSLMHVSLQTGAKHYVSLQDVVENQESHVFDECSPRVNTEYNFYYALEDVLQERLPCNKVGWSIHRPGLILGCSQRTTYNFIGSICVYGTICKYLNLPFVFGGTKRCWEEMFVDASDARLVAEQHVWAATTLQADAQGEAFNAVNGGNYTWKEIWHDIGIKLGAVVVEENMFSEDLMFSAVMADKGAIWRDIVVKEDLVKSEMEELANWDFIDILFRCPTKMLVSRDKADRMGFKTKFHALDSILYWIDVMRAQRLIP